MTYTGFHTGLLGLCGYAVSSSKEISEFVIGLILLTGGLILHISSIMTINSYKSKLKVNERMICEIEAKMNDYQQKEENEAPTPFLSSASKGRNLILWSLFLAELIFGLFFMLK